MGLTSIFGNMAGDLAGESFVNSKFDDLRTSMINKIDEVYVPGQDEVMGNFLGKHIFNRIVPGSGSTMTNIRDAEQKHIAGIEGMEAGGVEGFETHEVEINGQTLKVWIDASDPENPIVYDNGQDILDNVDSRERSNIKGDINRTVRGLTGKAVEDTSNYILENGKDAYLDKVENYIDNKLQDAYENRQTSFNQSPVMEQEQVRQIAESPTANINSNSFTFG